MFLRQCLRFSLIRHFWLVILIASVSITLTSVPFTSVSASKFESGSLRFGRKPLYQRSLHQLSVSTPSRACVHTVEGRTLIADDQGYLCNWSDLNFSTGCCPYARDGESDGGRSSGTGTDLSFRGERAGSGAKVHQTLRFSCQSCNVTDRCCEVYEQCVTCCQDPDRTPPRLATIITTAAQPSAGRFLSVFEFCRHRCRHNSKSVVHENAYISDRHHCYGLPVEVQAAADAAASAAAAAAAAKKKFRDGDIGSTSGERSKGDITGSVLSALDGDSVLAASEEPRRSSGDAAAAGASGDAGAAVGAVNGGGDGAVGEGSFRQGLEDVELKMEIGNPGQSCDDTCAERGLKCQADLLPRINNCPLLRHFFPCTPGCFASLGTEQPAEVVEAPLDIASDTPQHIHLLENPSRQNPQQRKLLQDLRGYSRQGQVDLHEQQQQQQQQQQQRSQAQFMPRTCLVSLDPNMPSCEGSHPDMRRLCPCSLVHS